MPRCAPADGPAPAAATPDTVYAGYAQRRGSGSELASPSRPIPGGRARGEGSAVLGSARGPGVQDLTRLMWHHGPARTRRRYHRPSGCYTDAVGSSQLIEIPAVDRLVAELARHPEVVRVWLFGSRARGDHRARSDVDLAVEAPGASRRAWLDLCRLVEEAATLLRIDLVLIEDAPAALAQQIRREGRVLYER